MTKKKGGFYGVARGHKIGVYTEWSCVQEQIKGYHNPIQKKFSTLKDAEAFVRENNLHMFTQDEHVPVHRASSQDTEEIRRPPFPSNSLIAFCYGSVADHAGFACIFPDNPALDVVRSISAEDDQKSNRAVCLAAVAALVQANRHDPSKSRTLYVFTNSQYVTRSMTEWIETWVRDDEWKTTDGRPVKNQDVLEVMLSLSNGRDVRWEHLKDSEQSSRWHAMRAKAAKSAAGTESQLEGEVDVADMLRSLTI